MMQYVRGRHESFGIDRLSSIEQILTDSVAAALADFRRANGMTDGESGQ